MCVLAVGGRCSSIVHTSGLRHARISSVAVVVPLILKLLLCSGPKVEKLAAIGCLKALNTDVIIWCAQQIVYPDVYMNDTVEDGPNDQRCGSM